MMVTIPAGAQSVYISFSAEINPSTTENLIAAMGACVNRGVKEVCLLISTPGGGVMNGLNVYNVLKGMPFELTTHNVGNVDSIGNVIFLAGTKRYCTANATFMFHGVGMNVTANTRLEEKNIRERLDTIVTDQERIGSVIPHHSTITE